MSSIIARQVRSAETQERILQATLDLIASNGARAVSFGSVAKSLGISTGNVTYHFPTKRTLLAEAFKFHLRRVRSLARKTWQSVESDSKNASTVAARFLEGLLTHDRASLLANFELQLEFARDPTLREEVEAESDESNRAFSEMVASLGSTDAELDAYLLIAAFQGLALARLSQPDDVGTRARVRKSVRRLVETLY